MLRPERHPSPVRGTGERATAWIDHVSITVALGALLLGYSTVVEGRSWFWTVVLVMGLVSLVCAVTRTVGVRWVVPAGFVAAVLAVVWIFVPQTLVAGVVPTPTSLVTLADLLGRSRVLIMEEAAPAPAARPIVLLLTIAFALLVLVLDALLRRRRSALLPGVVLVAVFVTPALVSGRSPAAVTFVVAAAAWLLLLWSHGRHNGPRAGILPAAALAVGALVVGVSLPPALPDVTGVARDWGAPPPTVFGDGINPMLQLGQNLRRGETSVAATYTTTLEDTPYLRVAVLRDFNGRTWRPVPPGALGRAEGNLTLGEAIDAEPARTEITIRELRSTMLPTPYPATGVAGLSDEWGWNRVGQTLTSESADSADEQYTVTSLDVQPTAEQMRALPEPFRPGLQEYLELPSDVPPVVTRTAREVTAEADNDYDRALALQDHFRTQYQYSETAPVAGDYDGNGVRVLEEFLQERAGYCVHFSSAMAVMARSLDIPSRVVVGYAPGRAAGFEDDEQVYEITSDDLHAWPELYFESVGWVGFEPTPSVGTTTAFEEPQSSTSTPEGGTDQGQEQSPRAEEGQSGAAPVVTDEAPTGLRAALVTSALLLLAALLPGLLRLLQRRRRLGSRGPEPWWREVQATARDHGVDVTPSETPRAFADRLAADGSTDAGALGVLLQDVESSRYARPGTDRPGDADAARRVVASLSARGSRWERVKARLLPRSLGRRR